MLGGEKTKNGGAVSLDLNQDLKTTTRSGGKLKNIIERFESKSEKQGGIRQYMMSEEEVKKRRQEEQQICEEEII